MEEYVNETNEELENQEQECAETCVKEAAHTENKSKYKNTGLLKASVALMFASSMLSAGVTGYQILAGSKDNDDSSQKPQSTIGTVSDKKDTAPYISEDGYWVIDGVKTQFKAEGVNGSNGSDGIDGEDGTDGIYVKQARVVYNDKWNISSYIMFVMSDDTYITTNVQTNVMNDHYYEASNAEDIIILAENYGVSKIRLAGDVELAQKLNVESRLNIDLDENTLTYSATAPMSVKEGARLVVENGTFNIKSNTGVCLAEADSRLTFEEVNIKAKATVAEVLGADARITLKDSSVETVENNGNGYTAARNAVGSLFKVYGENANIEVRETAISTTLNIFAVDSLAKTVDINVKDCEVVSTAHFLDIDTSAVVPTLSLDDETMESSTLAGFATAPVVSGNFNFNPEYAGIAEKAFSVNGKWMVAEDFADLIAKVESGASINLTEDIDLEEGVIIDKVLTLNLNGFTITRTNDTSAQTIRVNAGGDLTINGEGTISGLGNSDYAIAVRAHDGGKVTINGGTYTNEGAGTDEAYDLIYASAGGQVVINGGTFKGQTPAWLLNLQDNTGSSIVVNGGIFHGYNPAESHTENPVENFVANGKVVVGNGEVYAVVNVQEFVENINYAEVSYVSLNADIDLVESWIITNKLTLNLNGHTITRTNDTSAQTIRVNAGGDLTINGEGTISGLGNSVYAIAVRAHDGGKVTINGGTFTNEGAGTDEAYDLIYASAGGQVVINGGTFKGQTPAWLLNLQDNTGASIVVNGGVFYGYNPAESHTENPVANFVAEGCVIVKTENIYNVLKTSLAEAIELAVEGSTIILTEDIVVTEGIVIEKEVTLDLGNYTISSPELVDLAVIKVNTNGKLTVNASDEGGINSASQNNDCSIALWARNGGEIIINGGIYTNYGAASIFNGKNCNNELIYTSGNGSKITINAGYFVGNDLNEKWGTRYTLNKHDSTKSSIIVNGGFFYKYNPELSRSENPVANFVSEGKVVVSDGETYAVISLEEFAEYANFEEINYVSLHTDIDLAESWIITRKLTLNLNGHTITRTNDTSAQTIRVNAGGDLTINGEGTISGLGNSVYAIAVRAHDGGKVTINGGTYTNEGAGTDEAYDLIYASAGGQVVINGGTFKGQTPAWLLNLQDNTGASIVVKGGTFVGYNPSESHTENPVANFVARDYKVVENKGVYTVVESEGNVYVSSVEEFNAALADVTVKTITLAKDLNFETGVIITRKVSLDLNNKTITRTNDTSAQTIRVNAGGDLTVNGEGTISGIGNSVYAIALRAHDGGKITINGGTYTNEGAGTDEAYDLIYASAGGQVVINGGTFKGQTPNWLLNLQDNTGASIQVKGGTFHGYNPGVSITENPVANFVAEGHIVTRSGNVYVVTAE